MSWVSLSSLSSGPCLAFSRRRPRARRRPEPQAERLRASAPPFCRCGRVALDSPVCECGTCRRHPRISRGSHCGCVVVRPCVVRSCACRYSKAHTRRTLSAAARPRRPCAGRPGPGPGEACTLTSPNNPPALLVVICLGSWASFAPRSHPPLTLTLPLPSPSRSRIPTLPWPLPTVLSLASSCTRLRSSILLSISLATAKTNTTPCLGPST